MRRGDFRRAFAVGERILDAGLTLPAMRLFWDPWEGERADGAAQTRRIQALNRLARAPTPRPWPHYYLGSLTLDASEAEPVCRFPSARYGWMQAKAGWLHLRQGSFHKAAALLKTALSVRPSDWRGHGFLAEAYLCLGETRAALAALSRAAADAPRTEKGEALAWRGELELWFGRYRDALRTLDRACESGGLWGYCWRGAAKLKLGRREEALADLDRALRIYPEDREAYVWRGEAKRELGRHRQALRDLERPPAGVWALFNRALVREALGDSESLRRDFAAIPEEITAYVGRKLRLPGGRASNLRAMGRVLRAGLRLARGFRRDDYGQAVWMR